MRNLAKVLAVAGLAGGGIAATAAPANADVGLSIGIGPGYYTGYDYYRPCSFYRYNDLPAPARCYRYLYGYWGRNIYVDGDFIFRDRGDWWRWHDRDDYRHWRHHDFGWRGHDEHRDGWHDGGDHRWDHHDDHGGDRWNRGGGDHYRNGDGDHHDDGHDHHGDRHDGGGDDHNH
jgi:hypothetical protein